MGSLQGSAQTPNTQTTTPVPVAPVTLPPSTQTQGTAYGTNNQNQYQTNQTNQANQQTRNNSVENNQGRLQIQAPEPPTEFQELVAGSTGRILPIFGASLFAGVPSTFAPVMDVPVGSNYVIGPSDELTIQVSGQVNQQYDLTVDRSGNINVPNLGVVHVAGVPFNRLNTYLEGQFGRIYRNFTLSSNLASLRTIQVFVVGEARRPGSYSISSLSTLLNAVFASGGPKADGSLRNIEVKRDGKTLVHFDLYDLLLHGDKTNDIPLLSGDVIYIPFAGPQVAIAGSVSTPAIYELKGPTSIADALKLAGGQTAVAGQGDIRLERVYEHEMRSVQDVNLATQGAEVLQNGDIVSVNPIVDRFKNAVTLRGNVANPGRYVWHPGMRLSELIPNKASLITRNYWNKQNQLGMFIEEYQPTQRATPQSNEGALGLNTRPQAVEANAQTAHADDRRRERRVRTRRQRQASAQSAAQGVGPDAATTAGGCDLAQ